MAKDYYAILGVSRNATSADIRKRFLELAREKHPDRAQGEDKEKAELEFQAITEAFNILTNPNRRRELDFELSRAGGGKGGSKEDLAKAYLQRGVKAFKAKNYLEAADNFDRATKADPTNALGWKNLAIACTKEERWMERATKAIARACELEPMNTEYLEKAGQIFNQAGMAEEAERYYNLALKWGADPEDIEAALAKLKQGEKKGRRSIFGGVFGKSDK
jgi:curved DNA-binding protein CbpA